VITDNRFTDSDLSRASNIAELLLTKDCNKTVKLEMYVTYTRIGRLAERKTGASAKSIEHG
jgi:hypothetical protein